MPHFISAYLLNSIKHERRPSVRCDWLSTEHVPCDVDANLPNAPTLHSSGRMPVYVQHMPRSTSKYMLYVYCFSTFVRNVWKCTWFKHTLGPLDANVIWPVPTHKRYMFLGINSLTAKWWTLSHVKKISPIIVSKQ